MLKLAVGIDFSVPSAMLMELVPRVDLVLAEVSPRRTNQSFGV
jgi:hypothetical protein